MYKTKLLLLFSCILLLTSCWSSKEIEEQSVYVGLAVDIGEPVELETQLEDQSDKSTDVITATIQIVPQKSTGSSQEKGQDKEKKYLNLTESGGSVFEIMRQYSLRRDRPVIGHHLKVFIMSTELVKEVEINKLLDFMLRDNDIRPSCLVFLSSGKASETLESNQPNEIPSFHIYEMVRNRFRNNKILDGVNLTHLDEFFYNGQSFLLQNIAVFNKEIEFSGAGIIKGETGKWIGNLDKDDVSSISFIRGDSQGGIVQAVDGDNITVILEILGVKSNITPKVEDGKLIFHVNVSTEGRLIENWNEDKDYSERDALEEAELIFKDRIKEMLVTLIEKLQQQYKAEVAGFGKRLSITHPREWKKVKDHWDDAFSGAEVSFDVRVTITDYGASTE